MPFEPLNQEKAIITQFDQFLCRFSWLNGKGAITGLVVAQDDLTEGLVLTGMVALQVCQEGADCSDKQTDPAKVRHVGKNMHRIKSLL